MNVWYAFQETENERSEGIWDTGTKDLEKAKEWLIEQKEKGNVSAQIAVIDDNDNFCIDIMK